MSRHLDEPERPGRRKGRKPPSRVAPAPTAVDLAGPDPSDESSRPPGQRLYDMPFSSVAPRLIKPELGLHNLVARAGHNAAYEIDVTLLDAPDHRLIRSGVLLAHRVLDGRGEWFLTAPDWQPLLPRDRIELMGHADLPDELASLVRPLRRRATLGPVAALRCERREFALRDDTGTTLALLRDDKVTVRRGGLTTARYREVTLTPVGPGLTGEQRAFVDRAFAGVGANRVPRFPRLVSRLGAPATGPSDVPEPEPFDGTASLRRFVSTVLARRLREVVRSDLAVNGGDAAAGLRLGLEATGLRAELAGLSGALEEEWAEDLVEDLDWLAEAAASAQLVDRLRTERYLSALERLVSAARTPRLTVPGSTPATEALTDLLRDETSRLRVVADPLGAGSGPEAWAEVRRRLEGVRRLAELAEPVLPGAAETLRTLRKAAQAMAAVPEGEERAAPDLAGLGAEQAFAAGREHERAVQADRAAREEFVRRWAKTARKLDR